MCWNFAGAILWTEWLVSREKTKGTVAWLRTVPMFDRQIVSAKFVLYFLFVGSLWMSRRFLRSAPWPPSEARGRFRQKSGHVLPLVVSLLPLVLIGSANDRKVAAVVHMVQWASTAAGKLVVSSLLLAFSGLCCAWTMRWVSRSDTQKLLE